MAHLWGSKFVAIVFFFHNNSYRKQETAKAGMTGLQSGNIIGKDPSITNINAIVNIKYCMTLNRQSQG